MSTFSPRLARLFAAVLAAGTLVIPRLATADPASDVFALVNQQRAAHGLPALNRNSALDRSASSYAAQMASQGLGLLFLKFSRKDESQADELGVRCGALIRLIGAFPMTWGAERWT